MIQHLRFRHLEMVRHLIETGSLRTTAGRMNLTPPALSKSLREVEASVGAALFERTPRGLRATAAGVEFGRHAGVMLRQLDGLRECGQARTDRARPILRLGTAPFIAWRIMPGVLRRLEEQEDHPRVQLIEGRIIPLADQVVNGELDAIFTLFTPEALQVLDQRELALDQLHAERIHIVAGREHPLARRRTDWATLARESWILPPPTYTQRLLVQRACLEAGVLPPEPVIETSNIPAMLRMVMEGLGLAVTFEATVREDLRSGRLREVHAGAILPPVPIGLASRRSRADPRPVQALRDAIRTHVAGSRQAAG